MQLHPHAETPSDVRRRNRASILSLLRDHGMLPKSELARLTKRTMTTVSTIIDELVSEGLVNTAEATVDNGNRGRPALYYGLNLESWCAIGLQITSDTLIGVVMTLDGAVLREMSVSAPPTLSTDHTLDQIKTMVATLIADAKHAQKQTLGIGVALEGLVDTVGGTSLSMPFRPTWSDVPVAAYLKDNFGLPVILDWRVYAATLAEALYGAARGVSEFAYLNVDTGISGAIVASDTLIRSSKPAGISGDFSHVIMTGGTRLCYCGRTGCIQTEITTPALLAQLDELIRAGGSNGVSSFWQGNKPTINQLITATHEGDKLALGLQSRFARYLELAISSAIQLFSANMLIIGGQSIEFGGAESLIVARRTVQNLATLHPLYHKTRVEISTLKPDPATIGAATLIIQAVFEGRVTPIIATI